MNKVITIEDYYKRQYCEVINNEDKLIYVDHKIKDMYMHNFTYIKGKKSKEETIQLVNDEIKRRKSEGNTFLRVEFDYGFDNYEGLIQNPEIEIYDYMILDLKEDLSFKFNEKAVVKVADNKEVLEDGMRIDVKANEGSMGTEFAIKRIKRKAEVFSDQDSHLDLYVVYIDGEVAGNCEFIIKDNYIKIEDFDIYEKYQRKGLGSAMINHFIKVAKENHCDYIYLITDKSDTAKEMYQKLGFKKISEKTELFFSF